MIVKITKYLKGTEFESPVFHMNVHYTNYGTAYLSPIYKCKYEWVLDASVLSLHTQLTTVSQLPPSTPFCPLVAEQYEYQRIHNAVLISCLLKI